MSDIKPDPPPHSATGRTEAWDDGMVHAWVTLDDEETYIGYFIDERHAQFSIDSQIQSAEARWAA